jgi:prevent-host-death family protein
MKTVTAKDLKNRTGTILRSVNKGERVIVTKRGKPYAIISPLQSEQLRTDELRPYTEVWADSRNPPAE